MAVVVSRRALEVGGEQMRERHYAVVLGRTACTRWHAGERYRKLRLPTYAFEETVHWENADASMYVPSPADAVAAGQAALAAGGGAGGAGASGGVERGVVDPLLVRLRGAERRWATAYCLAYAGGSTSAFGPLARGSPEWLEVVGVEMPGSGELADAQWPCDGVDGAADAEASAAEARMMRSLAQRIARDAEGSAVVLVGWSMGGMLAAELALALSALGATPRLLHVAGRMAPGSFVPADDVEKFALSPAEARNSEAWSEWVLPRLVADLRADARAERRVAAACAAAGSPPLACPLQVCAGIADACFPPEAAAAWRPLSSGPFEHVAIEGGHEMLRQRDVELLGHLTRALLPPSPLYAIEWPRLHSSPPPDTPADARADAARASAPIRYVRIGGGARDPVLELDADAASDAELAAALGSAAGLHVYVPPRADVPRQQEQCWAFVRLAQRLTSAGAAGRLVVVCPADGVCGALVAGASKAVPQEAPEIRVQRLYLPPSLDMLRGEAGGEAGGGPMASLLAIGAISRAVTQGWLGWLSGLAASHPHETDLWIEPSPPHALRAPRLAPQPPPPPAAAAALDGRHAYVVTGGSGGLGAELVRWMVAEQRVPPAQIATLSRRGAAWTPAP